MPRFYPHSIPAAIALALCGPLFGQGLSEISKAPHWNYQVPQQNFQAFLRAQTNGACEVLVQNGIAIARCSRPATGQYGQIRVDNSGKPFVNGRPQTPANNQASAAPPPAQPVRQTYIYQVPEQNHFAFLQAQPRGACQGQPRAVHCDRPALGNFGQVRVDDQGNPSADGRRQPPPSYPIPATPPPAGVPAAQQAKADQLWNRASGLVDRNNAKDAMQPLYQCALMGDRRCEATMGIRYQDGDGVKEDDRAAAYWFQLAAAQNHRASQYALAGMYFDGEGGLPVDERKATDLLIKSANQGFAQAQYALAFQYELGDGVPRSRGKAIELFRNYSDGPWIASVLADPRTPASFKDMVAFGNYLGSLRNAAEAASWRQAMSALPKGGACQPGDAACAVHAFHMQVWQAHGGSDSGVSRPSN